MKKACLFFLIALMTTSVFAATQDFVFSGNISSTVDKLPDRYAGDDFNKVFEKLYAGGQKDEFEKTEDFKKRLVTNDDSIYAFRQELSGINRKSLIKYNADDETLTIIPNFDHRYDQGYNPIRARFIIKKADINLGTYTAQNSFGAQANVQQAQYNVLGIDATNIASNFIVNDSGNSPIIRIKIPPEEARRIVNILEILIIATPRLDGELAFSDKHYLAPSLRYPNESVTMSNVINMKILQVWIYNPETGHVFAKKIVDTL